MGLSRTRRRCLRLLLSGSASAACRRRLCSSAPHPYGRRRAAEAAVPLAERVLGARGAAAVDELRIALEARALQLGLQEG